MRHTAIAEAGNTLVEFLRTHMVPETIMNPDHIGLCSPADKGDLALGICLYDIRECEEIRSHTMIMLDPSNQKYPPSFLNLYYMFTAYSNGDIKYRAEEEQRILGRTIQILCDHAIFEHMVQGSGTPDGETVPTIEIQNLTMEEKMRIWSVPNTAYKTSLFYKLGPVEIESERTKGAQRVVDAAFAVEEHKGRRDS